MKEIQTPDMHSFLIYQPDDDIHKTAILVQIEPSGPQDCSESLWADFEAAWEKAKQQFPHIGEYPDDIRALWGIARIPNVVKCNPRDGRSSNR